MKTLIKSLALALTLGFTTSAATFAETDPGVRPTATSSFQSGIYTTISGKLRISLDKQAGRTVDVRLKNTKGDVLYSERLGKNESKYRTLLNMDELPDGNYQVEITNGVETTTHTVMIATKTPATPNRLVALNQ